MSRGAQVGGWSRLEEERFKPESELDLGGPFIHLGGILFLLCCTPSGGPLPLLTAHLFIVVVWRSGEGEDSLSPAGDLWFFSGCRGRVYGDIVAESDAGSGKGTGDAGCA